MARRLICLLCLLLSLCSIAAAQNLEKVAATANGMLYLDKDEIVTLSDAKKQAVLLVQTEEQFTNATYLKQLRASAPQLEQAVAVTRILMFNNDGTQVAIMKTLFTDKDDNIVYSIEGSVTLQPVKSKLIMQVYEKALDELEHKKRINDMLRKKI